MEFNPRETEKLLGDYDSGESRFYNCGFCKKGFSNAQAFGGHMNIHRRDIAKLKQLSSNYEQNFLSLNHHRHHHHKPSISEEEEEVLFDRLFSGDDHEDNNYSNNLHKKVMNIINVSSSTEALLPKNIPVFEDKIDIDLELRLGLEPHQL